MKLRILVIFGFIAVLFSGCGPSAKELVQISASTLEERQLQSRNYTTDKYLEILSASTAVIQDMGFNIDEIERNFGVVSASKNRDARETGQQIRLLVLTLLSGVNAMYLADHTQTIRITVVAMPVVGSEKTTTVRATFQRVLFNYKGAVTSTEIVKDEKIYQEFFDRLSKSIFLEANKI